MLIFWVLRKSTKHSTNLSQQSLYQKKKQKQKTKKQVPQEQLEGCFLSAWAACLHSACHAHTLGLFSLKKQQKLFVIQLS